MRLHLVTVGRLKDGPEKALCTRYASRVTELARGQGFGGFDMSELSEGRGRRMEERRREEADAILARLPGGPVIAFDERGLSLSSEAFAQRVGAFRAEGGAALGLVIGGADGLDDAVRTRAGLVVAFGALTLPHQLARVLVLEQIYRAFTILSGHPYHRA